jgi:sterol desaturase/sphingolipid hydroxylase (fatty acid hydroxylase superfamily)
LGTIGVDVVLLTAGISPNVMVWLGPFNLFHSAFVHANLNWDLGPFRYVIATPVFHRWHHTTPNVGGNTNFAGTFPIWDILFRTFRMPVDRLPGQYGVDDQASFPAMAGNWPIRSGSRCTRSVVARSGGLVA